MPSQFFLTNSIIRFNKRNLKTSKDYLFSDCKFLKLNEYIETNCTSEDKNLIESHIKSNLKDDSNYDSLFICRTKFTLDDHENQLLAELTNYLQSLDNRLDLAALHSIYDGFVSRLRSLGQETYNPVQIVYNDLKINKGFSRTDLLDIYKRIKNMMIPVDFKTIHDFAIQTLAYNFSKNYMVLKSEYRDFGLYAQKNQKTYTLILDRISKIDVSTCETTSLFNTIYNELSTDPTISYLEFFKNYYEYIIIVYIYKV